VHCFTGCLTTFGFIFALAACASAPGGPSFSLEQPRVGVYGENIQPHSVPGPVHDLVESVIPPDDVIRGVWSLYPHGQEPGRRVNIQVNSRIWVEILPSKQTTRYFVESRGYVRDEPGTILLRLRNPESAPNPHYTPLEAFVPDAKGQSSLFRTQEHGIWGDWQTGTVMNEIK